jgi:hypothetical protein
MGRGGRISWNPEDGFGASAALEGLAALAIGITAVCALVRIKTKGDAARRCFPWLFATMGVCLVYVRLLYPRLNSDKLTLYLLAHTSWE